MNKNEDINDNSSCIAAVSKNNDPIAVVEDNYKTMEENTNNVDQPSIFGRFLADSWLKPLPRIYQTCK